MNLRDITMMHFRGARLYIDEIILSRLIKVGTGALNCLRSSERPQEAR